MKKILTLMLLGCLTCGLFAQQSVLTSGGNVTNSTGSVSCSVGQLVSVSSYTLSPGVQHPYEIFVITKVENAPEISLKCSAYPNPVTDYLTLTVSDTNLGGLSYCLLDLKGKILSSNKIKEQSVSVPMAGLLPSVYFLNVFKENVLIYSFKLIKN